VSIVSHDHLYESEKVTYIKQELLNHPLLSLFLQEDVALRVYNKHLAVLRHNALFPANRTGRRFAFNRSADAGTANLLLGNSFLSALLAGLALLHALLAAIHGARELIRRSGIAIVLSRSIWKASCECADTLNTRVIAPGSPASVADVPTDELLAPLPAHDESEVVHAASANDEEAQENRAQTWAETRIVVPCALPLGEPVPEEVIVAFARWALEDLGDDGQALVSGSGIFHEGIALLLGRLPVHAHATLVLARSKFGLEVAVCLIRVNELRLLAIGLVELVLGSRGLDAQQIVEGYIVAIVGSDFGLEFEDFMIWRRGRWLAGKRLWLQAGGEEECNARKRAIGEQEGTEAASTTGECDWELQVTAHTYPLLTRPQQPLRICTAADRGACGPS